MVLFCRNSAETIEFRKPVEDDFLGSETRKNMLLPKFEVPADYFKKSELVQDADIASLAASQLQGAVGHWKLMRTVLPTKVWETW